ncbi:hypothetical protein GCM10009415_49320 [Chitinophaga japonensis]
MAHAITLKPSYTRRAEANTPPPTRRGGWIERCIVRFRAKKHAKKIMRTLHEIEEIHAGRKTAKSLEDFLKDF